VHILPDFADKAGYGSALGRCAQEVRDRAAGILLKQALTCWGNAALREVDQQFSEGYDIVHNSLLKKKIRVVLR
jgi:hypothetical protein